MPRRTAREVANLDPTTVVGNNGSPARNTRARFAVAAAALVAVMTNNQANAHPWDHRKHSPMAHKLELNEVANAVMEGDKMLNYVQLIQYPVIGEQWRHSSSNGFGRLAQGICGKIKETDTMRFTPKQQVPEERMKDVTYGKCVCNVRPEKDGVNRTRFVVGGSRINYPGNVGTPTADMLLLSQDPFQQCNFNQECKVYDGRHQEFLPEQPTQKEGVHKVEISRHPPRGHQRIQVKRHKHQR